MEKDYDPLAVIVGNNIKKRREILELSKQDLADKLDVTLNSITRMERGIIAPKMSRLPDIAEFLQCSIPYLFRGHAEEANDRATHIMELLRPLPPGAQDAVVEWIAHGTKVLGDRPV